ncbi:MAG TPA: LysM peptidoglycan-binding domain-containing protein [Anaerolineaceae bacterium]|jgi:LysM repeat protein|nr:LysM peptidoglycan-binding domain-containing protein [Anaerolineaceae bacterium]
MAKKKSQSPLASYRRKQKSGKALVGVLAGLFIVAGLALIALWATGNLAGTPGWFATKTPTPTITLTPTPVTPTNTTTHTPTITETPTITPTFTPSAPFEYVVQEDDNCAVIAEKYDVDVEVLLYLNNLDSSCIINVGQTILIPAPGQELPTATPLPTDIRRGTVIEYKVRSGDTLEALAIRFNSTVDKILYETNRWRRTQGLTDLKDSSNLFIGDILKIPVNLVTPVPTATATRTMTPSPTR